MGIKRGKAALWVGIAFLILLVAAGVCFFQFIGTGYRMTVPWRASFEAVADNVYMNRDHAGDRKEAIQMIDRAKERVETFFGDLRGLEDTIIILCDDDRLLAKLGGDHDTINVVFPTRKHYICVSDEYLNVDVLAHELTHAELNARLSASAMRRIPTWFDEGLSLQNDCREQYSEEQWVTQTDSGKNIVALEDMDTPLMFYAGEAADRRLRYLNAKHELAVWMAAHGQHGLLALLEQLNGGADFHTAYGG